MRWHRLCRRRCVGDFLQLVADRVSGYPPQVRGAGFVFALKYLDAGKCFARAATLPHLALIGRPANPAQQPGLAGRMFRKARGDDAALVNISDNRRGFWYAAPMIDREAVIAEYRDRKGVRGGASRSVAEPAYRRIHRIAK